MTLTGCGKSDSARSGGNSSRVSGLEKEAEQRVLAEIKKRWTKDGDGWVTARTLGSAYAPDHLLRQCRELTVEGVRSADLSDADHLNGLEWSGEVSFKSTPCREVGDPGILLDGIQGANLMRQRGRWSQCVDVQPDAMRAQNVKGQWQVMEDTWLLRGTLPTAEDFAKAGVKQ